MRIRLTCVHLLWLSLVMGGELQAAPPAGSCDSYTWDVSKERALFATTPTVVVASTEMQGAPRLRVGQLYEFHLSPSPQIGRLPVPHRANAPSGRSPRDGRMWRRNRLS